MLSAMSKKRGPKGSGRQGIPTTVYLPADLRQALDQCAQGNRRTLTAEVMLAVEAHLKAAGLWPPGEEVEE